MRYPEKHYRWQWHLNADLETVWPLISNTNRFDRDAGLPAVRSASAATYLDNGRLRARISRLGIPLNYVQEPFEWIYPSRFGVLRRYESGPVAELRVLADLTPQPDGSTILDYKVWTRARQLIGLLAIPIQVGLLFKWQVSANIRRYNELLAEGKSLFATKPRVQFASGGRERMARAREALLNDGAEPALLSRLIEFIEQADPLALSHMRPYALADLWGADRRATLQLFLMATRRGLLNLQWDLLCPMCRGARASLPSLGGITREVHCPACNINYKANFERSVELTFRPNPAIRPVEEKVYCIGSPQDTPHVVSQQLLGAGDRRAVMPALEPGRYRLRAMELHGWQALAVAENGAMEMTIAASEHGWPNEEPQVCPTPTLLLENLTPDEQLIILERIAWTDQAATAAEVTLLQMFRDLFANEALRPGEQISVGSLAILFTDLRGSTRLYREIGDAPAFGLVMDHFDLLREAVNAEGGVIVKTLGDSIMAAFRAPLAALRAALRAQRLLAESNPPLHIKVGLHFGPCIAVTLNDRLDYFGSSVNIAARLENLSAGDDVVISADVAQDPEVQVWLNTPDAGLETKPIQAALKGFDQERFDLYSVRYETEKEAV